MEKNSELKQMLASNNLDFDQLKNFRGNLQKYATDNVSVLGVPPKLNQKLKDSYAQCVSLLDKSINADTESETRTYLHQVTKILDASRENLFQQALINLSNEKLEQAYDSATDLVNSIANKENTDDQLDKIKKLSWSQIIVMIHELRDYDGT